MFRMMRLALFLLLPALLATGALAQSWPSRTVRFVVPTPAGSSVDIVARVVAEKLAATIGQAVIVEAKCHGGNRMWWHLLDQRAQRDTLGTPGHVAVPQGAQQHALGVGQDQQAGRACHLLGHVVEHRLRMGDQFVLALHGARQLGR